MLQIWFEADGQKWISTLHKIVEQFIERTEKLNEMDKMVLYENRSKKFSREDSILLVVKPYQIDSSPKSSSCSFKVAKGM